MTQEFFEDPNTLGPGSSMQMTRADLVSYLETLDYGHHQAVGGRRHGVQRW